MRNNRGLSVHHLAWGKRHVSRWSKGGGKKKVPVHVREKDPWYSLIIWLGGSQGQFERFREVKNIFPLAGIEQRLLDCPAHSLVTTEHTDTAHFRSLPFNCLRDLRPTGQKSAGHKILI